MGDFQNVCKVTDVAEGEGITVEVGTKAVALFKENGQFFAIDDFCPHMGSPLSGGYLENGTVTCPWHAWRFRLADGAWADNPRLKIGCHRVRIEGDQVQVQIVEPEKSGLRSPHAPREESPPAEREGYGAAIPPAGREGYDPGGLS